MTGHMTFLSGSRVNGKWSKPKGLPPVTHFCQQGSTSLMFYNLPRQGCKPRTNCLKTNRWWVFERASNVLYSLKTFEYLVPSG